LNEREKKKNSLSEKKNAAASSQQVNIIQKVKRRAKRNEHCSHEFIHYTSRRFSPSRPSFAAFVLFVCGDLGEGHVVPSPQEVRW
jgi:hypothetical protein